MIDLSDSPVIHAIKLCGHIVIALGALFILYALAGDWLRRRRHGRTPRCTKCGYNMTGLDKLKCPECGHVAKSSKELLSSRHYWGRACVGLIAVLIGTCGLLPPIVLSRAWIPRMPSIFLIWLIHDPSASRASYTTIGTQEVRISEIWHRYLQRELSSENRKRIVNKQFTPDRLPLEIQSRHTWPVGVPIFADFRPSFGGVFPRELRIVPRIADAQGQIFTDSASFYTFWYHRWRKMQFGTEQDAVDYRWPTRDAQCENRLRYLGASNTPMTQIVLDAQILEEGELIWSGSIPTNIKIEGTIDDLITPLATPAVQTAVQLDLATHLRLADGAEWVVMMPNVSGPLRNLTVGADVEFLFEAQVVASAQLVWTYADQRWEDCNPRGMGEDWLKENSQGRSVGACEVWRMVDGDTARLANANAVESSWVVRIRGNGALALQDFNARTYWSGEITLPLSALKRTADSAE